MTLRCSAHYHGGNLCRRTAIMRCASGHAICRAHFIRIGLEDPAPFACALCGAHCTLIDEIVTAFREAESLSGREAIDSRA